MFKNISLLALVMALGFLDITVIASDKNSKSATEAQSVEIQALKERVKLLEKKIEEIKNYLPEGALANDNIQLSNQLSDKSDYDEALSMLKDGDFAHAEERFFQFMKNHPSSALQNNAMFWYAESFYLRGVFDKAAINYLKCYKQYPKGQKTPDALLKLTYSLEHLNKNKEACNMLKKLKTEFPKQSSDFTKRVKDATDSLRCK